MKSACRGYRQLLIVVALVAAQSSGCSRPNPAFCCISEESCAAAGADELRPCPDGLACINTQCEAPSCASEGCTASAPVCEVTTDTCVGCASDTDCDRFPETMLCDSSTGSCVECVHDADCESVTPVCDGGACRGCALDSECPSAACGNDGACVAEDAVVYLAPNGVDSGTCMRSAPCRNPNFGVSRTSAARRHIVMAPGTYTTEFIRITPQSTQAPTIVLHGGGATIVGTNSEVLVAIAIPSSVRDLVIDYPGTAISLASSTLLERMTIRAGRPFAIESGAVTIRELIADATFEAIRISGGSLQLDRAMLRGGQHGVVSAAAASTSVDFTNVLVFDTTDTALELSTAQGTLSFVTVAFSGRDATTVSGIRCGGVLTSLRSSIVWNPNSVRTPVQNCIISSSIVGPPPVAGASNVDPLFLNQLNDDYHLAPNSPARDMVDTGPAADFEGDPRPAGPRFDIGADEIRN